MALIKCPECGKEISEKSKICINCGFPVEEYLFKKKKTDLTNIEQKQNMISDARNVSVRQNKKVIEIEDYKLKIILPGCEIVDYIWNFTLEYFAISMGMSVGLAINNVSKEYTSGIVDITCNGEVKKKLILFKEIMENNGLYSRRSRADILFNPNEIDKRLEDKRIERLSENVREKKKFVPENEEFKGIYRSRFGHFEEVYCPKCGSENCSHYQEQKIVPGKTKTRYTVNLNPLKPFTLVNKKEKVVKKEQIVTESKFVCNVCGKIFE